MKFPTDVPVHRHTVGAMFVGQSQQGPPTKRYVYRGIGVDQLETAAWLRAEAERTEAEKWERERRSAALRAQRQRAEQRQRKTEREAERLAEAAVPNLIAQIYDGINASLARAARAEATEVLARMDAEDHPPKPERKPYRKPIRGGRVRTSEPRPSPGWQPTSGDDLDALLAELGDDD